MLTGLMIDEVIGRYSGSGNRTMLTDALGSVIAEARDDRTIATRREYTPYGQTTSTGEASANDSQYTARENDGTGLYFYRARYYDAQLKRFPSDDRLGLAAGVNRQAYVDGDPVSKVDPTGELAWGLVFGGADLAWQLYQNGGNLKCVNWADVGMSMLGGGLLNALGKGAFRFKTVGSHTWDATRAWMNRRGIQMPGAGQHRHHWMFERNQGMGQSVSDAIKNQPWNTNPISPGFNNWLSRNPNLSWLGGPSWAGEVAAGGAMAAGGSNDCECAR